MNILELLNHPFAANEEYIADVVNRIFATCKEPPRILSVSRRTDIPSYYSDWFFKRLKEGFVYTRNPMNPKQVSRLERLSELEPYPYYFQFTLTSYGRDVEAHVPHKKEVMVSVLQKLAAKLGSKRVIWRYDPILFTPRYTPEYHIRAFRQMAQVLRGCTEKCVISFVDTYAYSLG